MQTTPQILVIILNWNKSQDTIECLDSLRKCTSPAFDIIIVDNGSRKEELEKLKTYIKNEKLIPLEKNLGFAKGNNIAIREGLQKAYQYFFLLNNDTVIEPNCLKQLIETAHSDPKIGIIGAINYYFSSPQKVWYSGGYIDWKTGNITDPTADKTDLDKFPTLREVDDVAGSALFITKKAIDKIGLLEEKYFAYYEETDWCIKAKKVGLKVMTNLDAKIWHKVSKSLTPPSVQYLMTRNRILFMLRHAPKKSLVRFLFGEFKSFIFLRKNKSKLTTLDQANYYAYLDALSGKWGEGRMEQWN